MKHIQAIAFCSAVAMLMLTGRPAVLAQGQPGNVPQFEYDAKWPKPLPNNWRLGTVVGVRVDSKDHIWIVHRPSTLRPEERGAVDGPPTICCKPAPPVIEFDQDGNVIQAWGGPGEGFEWPAAGPNGGWSGEHGLFVDAKDNVWLSGNGPGTAHILKFTRAGKFVLQIGKRGMNKGGSNDTGNMASPTSLEVNSSTNEVFVADGYTNRRVIVFDSNTGAYKRHWGAYGKRPDDSVPRTNDPKTAPSQFNTVHGVALSKDGMVYVADRGNNRIQAFKEDGTFVAEGFVARETPSGAIASNGTVHDVDFSSDPQQQFLYVADGVNQRIWIVRRADLSVVGNFGHGGHEGGALGHITAISTDSKGNIYVGETMEGKRVQRFRYTGTGRPSTN